MIPFVNLKKQYQHIHKEVNGAIKTTLRHSNFVLGTEVLRFEHAYARYCGARRCVAVASGTDALLLSLRALQVGTKDEVVIPAHTFISTAFAVLHAGAIPVFADVDPVTGMITAEGIQQKLTKRTRAIIPVHIYGMSVDMDPILRLAKHRKLFVVEDACQAHGSLYKGKKTGSVGDTGCFSFYPAKNLGAYGDGGAIITNREDIAKKIDVLHNVGQSSKNVHTQIGYSSRLDAMQAAALYVKLAYLDRWNERRRIIASWYAQFLHDLPIILPMPPVHTTPNYHLYVIRTKHRDRLFRYLQSKNIGCAIHYPVPMHLQPCLRFLGHSKGSFPVSEQLAREVLSLPMYPELTRVDVQKISSEIRIFFKTPKNIL